MIPCSRIFVLIWSVECFEHYAMLRHVLNVLMRTGSCNPTQEDSAGSQGNKYPVQDPPSGVCTHTGLSSFIVNYHISGFHLPGDVLETAIIYPVGAGSSLAGAQAKIKELLLKHRWVTANYCSAIISHNKVRTDRYIVCHFLWVLAGSILVSTTLSLPFRSYTFSSPISYSIISHAILICLVWYSLVWLSLDSLW